MPTPSIRTSSHDYFLSCDIWMEQLSNYTLDSDSRCEEACAVDRISSFLKVRRDCFAKETMTSVTWLLYIFLNNVGVDFWG